MRLAIVTTHPIQYNAPWFKILSEQDGFEVMVFYTWQQSQNPAKHDPDFGKVIEWDLPLLNGYAYTFVNNIALQPGSHHYKGIDNPTLISEICEWKAEAILVFGWAFKSHLACLRYFKGKIPVLFRGDSTLLDEKNGIKTILRRIFLSYVYRQVDYALYVGTNNKRYFKVHGLSENQLFFAPHAIDNERFVKQSSKSIDEARLWRRDLGIAESDFVILFAGKFIEKKNPFFLIELAKLLPSTDIKFIFVGNGKLEQQLKNNSTDKRIIFLDFQNQAKMPLVYNLCNVFVLPSRGPGETWGLAINEAMACGKYVIATTKTGCAIDLIKEDKNGVIVQPEDADSAATFIQKVKERQTEECETVNKNLLDTYSYNRLIKGIEHAIEHSKR